MFRTALLLSFLLCFVFTFAVVAQDVSPRTRELAAALDKTKYKKKDKRDIHIEIYISINNVPSLKNSAADYTGRYESEDGNYTLSLKVASDGTLRSEGTALELGDQVHSVAFKLREARIDGGLLTGTKVFDDGRTEAFESAFVDRTVRTGRNAEDSKVTEVAFGLGCIQKNEDWSNRVFMKKQ
jgi:hypothetical protein